MAVSWRIARVNMLCRTASHSTITPHHQIPPSHLTITLHHHIPPSHLTITLHHHIPPFHLTITPHHHIPPSHLTITPHHHSSPSLSTDAWGACVSTGGLRSGCVMARGTSAVALRVPLAVWSGQGPCCVQRRVLGSTSSLGGCQTKRRYSGRGWQ